MAQGGIGNQSPASLFQARLDTTDGVSNTLTLRQYAGNKVVVSGITVPIPNAGMSRNVADNLIDAAGADSGAPGAANTLYYVYISNQKASFSPSSIRLSSTAPSLVNGVKYLGSTGNALNWRFVGWVRLNATPNFEFSDVYAGIVNYYNRLLVRLFTCPGFVNDGSSRDWAPPSPNVWTAFNNGVGNLLRFISNGEDAITLLMSADGVGGGTNAFSGIGIDGTKNVEAAADITNQQINGYNCPTYQSILFTEGVHTAEMSGATDGGTTFHLFSPVLDSTTSVFRSYLYANLMV